MLSEQERLDLMQRHGDAERRFDVAATIATLDDDPAYEWHPDAVGVSGTAAVTEMYEHFLANWRRLSESGTVEFEFRSEWFGPLGRIREEVAIVHGPDGTSTRYDYVVAVIVGDGGIKGERTYGSPDLLRLLLGPYYDRLPPLRT